MQTVTLDIIKKAADGDIAAFEQIYRASSSFVYSLALRIVRNPDDADEITQDVFMKIYRHLRNFRNESSLKTWIYRIAVNTSLNARKRRAHRTGREVVFDEALHSQAAAPAAAPEGPSQDRKERLDALLAHLNEDQKVVLLLREMEGLSYQEISDALQININTVRTRLKRARRALLTLAQREVIFNEL